MLGDKTVTATVAVRDLAKARDFYEGKLGLHQAGGDGVHHIYYGAGASRLLVYQSTFAGGYGATVATWDAGAALDTIVATLRGRGVTFEHYDGMAGLKRKGDIHSGGGIRNAWCKDMDGNILAFVAVA